MDIDDPIESDDPARWTPATPEAEQLVNCLLACKAVTRQMQALATHAPLSDTRGLTLLATPAISLLDCVDVLYKLLGKHDISAWPAKDQDNLRHWARNIRKHKNGPLRRVRNRLSAHHDAYLLGKATPYRMTAKDVLLPVCEALAMLTLLLNQNRDYVWTRVPILERPDILQVHQPQTLLSPLFRLENGHPVELVGARFMLDPRWAAIKIVEAAATEYNRLAALATGTLPRLSLREL